MQGEWTEWSSHCFSRGVYAPVTNTKQKTQFPRALLGRQKHLQRFRELRRLAGRCFMAACGGSWRPPHRRVSSSPQVVCAARPRSLHRITQANRVRPWSCGYTRARSIGLRATCTSPLQQTTPQPLACTGCRRRCKEAGAASDGAAALPLPVHAAGSKKRQGKPLGAEAQGCITVSSQPGSGATACPYPRAGTAQQSLVGQRAWVCPCWGGHRRRALAQRLCAACKVVKAVDAAAAGCMRRLTPGVC